MHASGVAARFVAVGIRLVLCACALSLVAISQPAAAEDRPNIVLILADDLGPGDLGCCGGTIAKTPRIDQLASEGTRFTQYYSAAPICSPSRAGLLTGQFPSRWQMTSFLQTRKGNFGCEQADFLDPRAPTLPRVLKDAGFRTAHVGKWHLGGGRDVQDAPRFSEYGYDVGIGTYESPEPHPDITATDWIWSPKDKVKRWERSGFFVDKTLEFLRTNKDQQPCFVNLWLDDPHTPWVPAEDAAKGDGLKNLRGVLRETDRQIGRLLDGLRELEIDQNTLVIFASDNGPLPTFEGKRTVGLRGSKLSLYEGGIRTPFLVRWPGKVPAGRVDDQTVLAAIDLLPSLAKLAGAKQPELLVPFDGRDMSAAFLGEPIATRNTPLYWEYGRNEEFFKFPAKQPDRSPTLALRDGPWKLLLNADGTGAELYDVVADRGETKNVATQQAQIVASLQEKLLAWRKSIPAPPPATE
jgi:arylsulfatase A-like enzyme